MATTLTATGISKGFDRDLVDGAVGTVLRDKHSHGRYNDEACWKWLRENVPNAWDSANERFLNRIARRVAEEMAKL